MLLTLSDTPARWTLVDVDDHPTEVPGTEDLDYVLASVFFQRSDLGPFLVHMLMYTEGESDTEIAFESIEAALESADILDGVTSEVRSWQTEPAEFASLGDETFAFKAIGDTGLIPVQADMVATRQGSFVSFIIHAELLRVDTELTEEFARAALDRLPE